MDLQQIVVRPKASTSFAAPRPTNRTHIGMTKARPTQPPIPGRPDNQRLETVTELRREAETQQQQNQKFTLNLTT